MTKIIYLDTQQKLIECAKQYGGFPDKTASPFSHDGGMLVKCDNCYRSVIVSEVDVLLNGYGFCPDCEFKIDVPLFIPDGRLIWKKLFWRGDFYKN